MSNASQDDDRSAEHTTSWSANLEQPRHADDRDRLVRDAREAINDTAAGVHVNLVTHGAHGDPREYLWGRLDGIERVESITFVDRCGCGGYVSRVHVE